MNNSITTRTHVSWTWADMFVTYRFWGLMLLYSVTLVNSGLVSSFLPLQVREITNDQVMAVRLQLIIAISGLLGFYVAWAATRTKALIILLIAVILQLSGALLLTPVDPFITIPLRYLGGFLFGLGVGAITLSIPAILVGGTGGAQAFIIAFGLYFAVVNVVSMISPITLGTLWDRFGSNIFIASTSLLAFLGLIALVPVNPDMFTKPPQLRTCNQAVRPRNPVLVSLGSLIIPYYFYFLYKFHGEIASLRPSPKIVSSRGLLFILVLFPLLFSALAGLLLADTFEELRKDNIEILWLLVIYILQVPIMLFLVVMTSLVEPLIDLAVEHGTRPWVAPWVIFVFSIIFPPVAMGLIQWSLNKSILVIEQSGEPYRSSLMA